MPELSQDAFEVLHPGVPPATAQAIRMRSNSGGNKLTVNTSGCRKKKISDADLDTFHEFRTPDYQGYKRESTHRYGYLLTF